MHSVGYISSNQSFLNHISGEGKFSIIDTYLELAKTRKIIGYIDDSEIWTDIGKPGQLDEATRLLKI